MNTSPFRIPSSMRHAALLLSSLSLLGGVLSGCGSGITCGDGTTLDKASNQCVPIGDLNVVVDDFTLGKFKMTGVDVPERLDVGTPDTRHFTLTNTGSTDRPVVAIRYAIVPVTATIDELRAKLASVSNSTNLDATIVGQVILEKLAAGEVRDVEYTLSVPNSVQPGLYGLYFAADEVPLLKGEDGQYQVDFSHGIAKEDNTVRLDNAAMVYAPATVIVGKPDKPNLRVLSATLDNSSFELDRGEQGHDQMFTLSARMSAQGMDVTEPVTAQFELRLPGHGVKVAGKDLGRGAFDSDAAFASAPDTTTYEYVAARSFPLYLQQTGGLVASKSYASKCVTNEEEDADGGVTPVEHCAVIFTEEGRDDVYALHLPPEAIRLLEQTRAQAALNPDLDANGEIKGTLVMTLTTTQAEYQDNKADNVMNLPVVFMAPEKAPQATANDTDNAGVTQANNGFGQFGPYPYVLMDNLSSQSFGNEWFGAGYHFETNASYDKHKNTVIAQYKRVSHDFDGTFLKFKVPILGVSGTLDWGADKAYASYKASGSVTAFGYTLLSASFDPNYCKTTDNLTLCPIFEAVPDQVTKQGQPRPKLPPKKSGRELSKSWEIHFQAGPVPLMIKAEAGISTGVKFLGEFAMDRSGLVPRYGVQFAMGPFAGLEATVFGGVSVGVARAGVEGNLQIVGVEFLPTIRPTMGVDYDSANQCFKYADTSFAFEGPFTVKGPNGSVSVVAYAGFKVCFFGKCIKGEKKVFSFTIASFSTFEKTWYAWQLAPRWKKQPGDEGMCPATTNLGPEVTWRSPTSCSNGYCASSSTNRPGTGTHSPANVLAAYKSTFTPSTGCVDVAVTGTTRTGKDRLVLYDASGTPVNTQEIKTCKVGGLLCISEAQYGWSGAIDGTLRVCSPNVTAALESTDGVVGFPGATVTFTPTL